MKENFPNVISEWILKDRNFYINRKRCIYQMIISDTW